MEPALPDLLKAHRENAGMSVAELARTLNITTQCVYGWQQGLAAPSYGVLMRIAKLFGLTMIELHTMPRGAAKRARRRAS